MSFYYPFGLLGLIGIPVIIIIYIIKSKYTEQTIASTYLWTLSEKFLKKRKRVSRLTGILTLILQCLAVLAVSLLIAHPVFTIPASANDYLFILDGSASMNMQQGGSTRFEKAQEEINKIINGSRGGSTYSLVFVRDTANVAFEDVTDKEQAKANVNMLSAGWCASECTLAVSMAQQYFENNPSALIYLVTDKEYEIQNINLIDVSAGEHNYALQDCNYKNGAVTGKVFAYNADGTVKVTVSYGKSLDGEAVQVAEESLSVNIGEPAEFSVKVAVPDYEFIKISIVDGDSLAEDDTAVIFKDAKVQSRRALIVSDLKDAAYFTNAISGAGQAEVEVMTSSEYEKADASGYELYVFNGYSPATLPQNAAIWLIDAIDGSNAETGVIYRDEVTPDETEGENSKFRPTWATGNTAQLRQIMNGVGNSKMVVSNYKKYGTSRNFTTVLSVGGDPLISVGLNANNDREVVFAFQMGNSDFGLMPEFMFLVKNLMDYSVPAVLDKTTYICGEIMSVNVVPGCENIVVTSPSGASNTLDTYGHDICEVSLTETGIYTVTVKRSGKTENDVLYTFSYVPESESVSADGGSFSLVGEREYEYSDGYYDELLAFFIMIAVLLLADWGVYCYEQYQLR